MGLHWIVAGLVVVAWLLGNFGDQFPRGSPWRIGDPPPAPEPTILGRWGDWAGTAMHYALYALIAAVIVLGIAAQFARGDALPIFGWFEIASSWASNRPFARNVKEIHEALANTLMILVGIHAAALFHHWILRDRTLLRILPGSMQ